MDLRRVIGAQPGRLLRLPDKGQLMICTDLHGNLRDFQAMARLFEAQVEQGADPFLLFTGDLVHGPSCTKEEWPEYLGSYFVDESAAVVEGFMRLQERYGRVACLIGNHEHSHVGGPHTPKFWPDETLHFEQTVGPKQTKRYRKLFRSFPAVAIARCGVVVTHAAPNAEITSSQQIEELRYEGLEDLPIATLDEMPILGHLLWSRRCTPQVARRFLDVLCVNGLSVDMVVFGHEIVAQGYDFIGQEQLMLSTSFGVPDANKTYLTLDLAGRYRGTEDLRPGVELLRLYPDVPDAPQPG